MGNHGKHWKTIFKKDMEKHQSYPKISKAPLLFLTGVVGKSGKLALGGGPLEGDKMSSYLRKWSSKASHPEGGSDFTVFSGVSSPGENMVKPCKTMENIGKPWLTEKLDSDPVWSFLNLFDPFWPYDFAYCYLTISKLPMKPSLEHCPPLLCDAAAWEFSPSLSRHGPFWLECQEWQVLASPEV